MVSETVPLAYEAREGKGEVILIPVAIFDCETSVSFSILCGLMEGSVIIDLEKEKFMKMPDLDKFSMSEFIILDSVLQLESFTIEQLSKEANISVFNAENILLNLLRKEIIRTEGKKYVLGDVGRFFKYPCEYATNVKITMKMINYDKKLEPNVPVEKLQKLFEHFMMIRNISTAYILARKNE
ncbi:MAG: hypothetical protein QW331_04400 [Candidatus Woesearchaeota archaeon]